MTDIDTASIERAVAKRRHFFLSNIQDLTMKMARRQIEKDLGLAPKHLDAAPFKTRIAELVDAVISSGDGADKENTHADKPVKTEKPKPKPERKEEVAAAKKPKRKSVIDSDDDDEVASMGGDVSEEEADYDDSDDDAGSDGSDEASDDDDDMPSDSDDDDIPKKKMKKKAPEPKKAKSKPAPKPSKPKQSAAPITGMVAKLRDQCKKAGLTYQHVFMKRKDDAGRTELLEQILADAGLSLRSDASAVAKVRKQKELEKDLDGIDTSAIIEGGRRRRAAAANGWGEKIDYATLNGKGKREKFGSDDDTTDNESSEDDDDDEDDSDVEVAVTSDEDDEDAAAGDADDEENDDDEEVVPMKKKPTQKSAEKRKSPDASGQKQKPASVKAMKLERRIASMSPSPSPTPAKRVSETAPAKRVSEIGVTPGDVFFDSSDDDVDPPAPVRAPVIEKSPAGKSPSASPVPVKKAAKPVRPGGVLWDSDDE